MSDEPVILILGQVLVDVTLPSRHVTDYKLRLGGVIHAARGCWALGVPFGLGFLAPSYLHHAVHQYAERLGARLVKPIGVIDRSPNVILVKDVQECGAQGYEHLLREELVAEVDGPALSALLKEEWTDVMAFPSCQDAAAILETVSSAAPRVRCHVDAGWLPAENSFPQRSDSILETMIASTSSPLFLEQFGGQSRALAPSLVGTVARSVLLKENRGGARLFLENEQVISVPAHVGKVAHSVGVGDVFDVAFVAEHSRRGREPALRLASLVAAAYARTTEPDMFAQEVRAWTGEAPEIIDEMQGVVLPWESRPEAQIYIAAPDFDYMDTSRIDELVDALTYHNFRPRRPVREFGQVRRDDPQSRREELVAADLSLLDQCQLLIAVMLSNDPGTLIEIGLAVQRRVPVLVYDPHRQAENLLLKELPDLVSSDLDEVVGRVFTLLARRRN